MIKTGMFHDWVEVFPRKHRTVAFSFRVFLKSLFREKDMKILVGRVYRHKDNGELVTVTNIKHNLLQVQSQFAWIIIIERQYFVDNYELYIAQGKIKVGDKFRWESYTGKVFRVVFIENDAVWLRSNCMVENYVFPIKELEDIKGGFTPYKEPKIFYLQLQPKSSHHCEGIVGTLLRDSIRDTHKITITDGEWKLEKL